MRLAETVTFAGSGLDRAAGLRGDATALAAHLAGPGARVLPIWRGKPLFAGDSAGWIAAGHAVLADAVQPPVFLGIDGGAARFACDISAWEPEAGAAPETGALFDPTEQRHPALPDGFSFAELRSRMAMLDARDAELAATGKAVLGWHHSHRFCSACGSQSEAAAGGWHRRCPACGAQHFPRTDPVVIMLVTRRDSALIGRSPGWPEGMYSCLAGFMEPGETIEAAVRREVAEETAIQVGAVRYLASQPWPFPASLMIGCAAEATSEAITVDPSELEDARWIDRAEMAEVLSGGHATIRKPRPGAIAGFLMSAWVADRLE